MMQPTEPIELSPDLEQLLRETMEEFWKQNNLGQKHNVVRKALLKAFYMGEDTEIQAKVTHK